MTGEQQDVLNSWLRKLTTPVAEGKTRPRSINADLAEKLFTKLVITWGRESVTLESG